jgi:glycosyltransferase involved in cell wall biosynthesis
MPQLLLSVAIITYKHEAFIEQCLEGVISQETGFGFEVVIGDDCSPDNTRTRIKRVTAKHQREVRVLERPDNIGAAKNLLEVFGACQGKYVALLEGDDYWVSTRKLERQVAFLEAHPECAMCFSRSDWIQEGGPETRTGSYPVPPLGSCYGLDDLLREGNFIATATAVYRREVLTRLPDWYVTMKIGDFPLHVLAATTGQVGFVPEVTAVHRRHAGGMWSGVQEIRRLQGSVTMYENLGRHLHLESRPSFRQGLARQVAALVWPLRSERQNRAAIATAWRALRITPGTTKFRLAFELSRQLVKRTVSRITGRA